MKKLSKFLSKIPRKCKIVQVTGSPATGYTSLIEVATRILKKDITHKPSSLETANLCASIVKRGFGFKLQNVDERFKIVVSRAMHPGKGGQSQQRYQRLLQVKVSEAAKFIKEILDENNIRYDLIEYKTDFGAKKVIFTIEELPDGLYRFIKNIGEKKYVKIKIIQQSRNFIFVPLGKEDSRIVQSKKPLIVGIDPGINLGLAYLDLNGNIVYHKTHKEWGKSDILRHVSKFGVPILLCSDVTPPPQIIEKLGGIIKTPVYMPSKTISVEEKRNIVQNYLQSFNRLSNEGPRDTHERDALVAAILGYMHFKPKFEKLRQMFEKYSLPKHYITDAKILMINGHSIASTIEIIKKRLEVDKQQEIVEEEIKPSQRSAIIDREEYVKKIMEYKKEVSRLERENQRLKKIISTLKNNIIELELLLNKKSKEEYTKILLNKEVQKREKKIEQLEREIDVMKNRNKELEEILKIFLSGNVTITSENALVKVISEFKISALEEYKEDYGIHKDDIVYIRGGGGGAESAKFLVKEKIKAIIVDKPISHIASNILQDNGIPILSSSDVSPIQIKGPFGVINKQILLAKIQQAEREIEEMKREKFVNALKGFIDAYRYERWKKRSIQH